MREDPLAAAAMTIPVNRVKLMAFAFGAVIAALAGTVFAAQQISVFPPDFNTAYLILIYAGLILGGAGSITGAVLGGLVVVITLDGFLRSPTEAGYIFYGLILVTLLIKLRPWLKLGIVIAVTIGLGFAAHAIAGAISPGAIAGGPQSGGWIASAVRDWVIVPTSPKTAGSIGFVLLVCLLIAVGPGPGTVADRPARARDLPGRVRVGGTARGRALDYPPDPDRGHPDRDDELPAAGPARIAAGRGGDMSTGDEQAAPAEPVLALDRVSLSFGGLRALSDLELHVGDREVVSVIGPNGAGKSTVFNVITGIYEPDSGDVRFAGQSIAGEMPHSIARLGIARTFQSLRLFLNMSVIENVMAATYGATKAMPWESILAPAARAARGARGPRAGRGRPVVLRPAARRVPLGSARVLAVVCEPAAAGDRPRARLPAAAAAARRASRRDESGRDARDH